MMENLHNAVSVVMPVFTRNTSLHDLRLLRRAIESVAIQKFPGPMELLIVDDGCPTPIQQFASQIGSDSDRIRISWLRHSENKGVVAALNTGIRSASYPLIARLDADDRWCEGKIEQQLALFEADPDLTITGTGMTRVTPTGADIDTHIRPAGWTDILDFFVKDGCPFPHGSIIARREIYRLLGGYSADANIRHCEDYALWGVWLRFFKPSMVEASLYEYTVSTTSVSSLHETQQIRASANVRDRFREVDIARTLPAALHGLAETIGCSLTEAGVLCYRLWKHRHMKIQLPREAVALIQRILPDRDVFTVGDDDAWDWRALLGRSDRRSDENLVAVEAFPA
jgi:glycosyltransferase involved in cell wall biosynthesis